jgi:hypothetical protein
MIAPVCCDAAASFAAKAKENAYDAGNDFPIF